MSTPDLILATDARQQLLEALRAGNSRSAAARYVGLHPDALEDLVASSPELLRDVEQAEAAVEVSATASIAKAAKGGDWRAATELLDRRPAPAPKRSACGAKTRAGTPCQQGKGHGTDHPGYARCKLHGGNTPNGRKTAEREKATAAVAKLGLPRGTGDPFELLETATRYSQGMLEATAQVLVDVVDKKRTDITLEAAARLHVDAIRQGAQTGHQAVTADVASRQAKVSEQLATVVIAAVQNGIGVYVTAIAAGKPPAEAIGLAEAAAADILEVTQPVGAGLN